MSTAAVARTLANLGQDFISPEVMPPPHVAQIADDVVDIILRGLAAPEPDPEG